jgi:hypothetical protein
MYNAITIHYSLSSYLHIFIRDETLQLKHFLFVSKYFFSGSRSVTAAMFGALNCQGSKRDEVSRTAMTQHKSRLEN